MSPTPRVRTVESMPFAENSYVAWLPGRTDAVVFDPGLEPELILDVLHKEGLTLAAILNTHGHADHIAGNKAMKHHFPDAPLVIGVREVALLSDPMANLSLPLGGMRVVSPPADKTVADGDTLEAAGMTFEVREIPGHSPGHVVFIYRSEPVHVFGGDVLFRDSIGNPDFPGGDLELLLAGIRAKLFTLPDDAIVFPGHGPTTTVGREKVSNPYLK